MPSNAITIADLRKQYHAVIQDHYHRASSIVKEIAEAIAPHLRLQPADLFIPRRQRQVTDGRFCLMFAMHKVVGASLSETGRTCIVGGVDHTSVIHAVKAIPYVARTDARVDAALSAAIAVARQYAVGKTHPCPSITGLHLKPKEVAVAA